MGINFRKVVFLAICAELMLVYICSLQTQQDSPASPLDTVVYEETPRPDPLNGLEVKVPSDAVPYASKGS